MKRTILLAAVLFSQGVQAGDDSIRYSYYHIGAERLSLDVVDSYPQRVLKYGSKVSPYEIIIQTFSASQDQDRRTVIESTPLRSDQELNAYPDELRQYLEPTALIESDSPIIKAIADTIVNHRISLDRTSKRF